MFAPGQPNDRVGEEPSLEEFLDRIEKFFSEIIVKIENADARGTWNDTFIEIDGELNPAIPLLEQVTAVLFFLKELLNAYLKGKAEETSKAYKKIRGDIQDKYLKDIDSSRDKCSAVELFLRTERYDRYQGVLRRLTGELRQINSYLVNVKSLSNIKELSAIKEVLRNPEHKYTLFEWIDIDG